MKKLFRMLMLAAVIFSVYKLMDEKKKWTGLTEDEARARLSTKLSSRVPAEKLDQLTDQIVEQMKVRGVLRTEPAVGNGSGV